MKHKLLLTTILLINNTLFAQGRYSERLYDIIGLADGNQIVNSLKLGIPIIIVGFLIAYFFIWRKSSNGQATSNSSQSIGCLGIIIMAVGFFCLLPLLAWMEAIFVSGVSLSFAIAIIVFIYYLFKK